jgi:hypothetical protein
MPRIYRHCLLAVALLAAAAPCRAQSADSAAVLGVVQAFLNTLATRDTAAARTLMMPGTRSVSIRGDTSTVTRVQSDTSFLRTLPHGTEKLLERIWSPVVSLRGPLATVWTPYDFHVDGKFSHCGIDAFTLLRENRVWRITEITYTVERTGCAPSPLGPPAR